MNPNAHNILGTNLCTRCAAALLFGFLRAISIVFIDLLLVVAVSVAFHKGGTVPQDLVEIKSCTHMWQC